MNVSPYTLSFVWAVCAAAALADYKSDIGYTALQSRLGSGTPTGSGIAVTQVEASLSNGEYLPDTTRAELTGKTITAKSGSSGTSWHATTVAIDYYGSVTSVASQVDQIDVYQAGSWLTILPSLTESKRIENHSWITSSPGSSDTEVLQRVDMLADNSGIVICTGVNNGTGLSMPTLLASAHNNIAVGRTDGISSYGPTTVDVSGRVKPDLVAPMSATSWASPVVAACAALLLQVEDQMLPTRTQTDRAILAKALLMAGATKDPFPAGSGAWRRGFATPSSDGTVPLDYRYGAGQVNINNSHLILSGGEFNPSTTTLAPLKAWDLGDASTSSAKSYFFEVPAFSVISRISILTTWNRHVTSNGGTLTASQANINLRFFAASGFTKGAQIDQSISSIDNVEHIYLTNLVAGRYLIEVTGDQNWRYAIAWDVTTAPSVKPDLNGDGAVDTTDFTVFDSCNTGPTVTPPQSGCERADLDNDLDVDQNDFGMLQRCLSGPGRAPPASCYL